MEYLIGFVLGVLVTLAWCLHRRCKGESLRDAVRRVNPLLAGPRPRVPR